MTLEQIKEAIEAEALKQSELNSETESFSTGLYTGWKYGCNWLLSQLSAWGYVKAPETDEELKIKCTQSIEALFDSDDLSNGTIKTITMKQEHKDAVEQERDIRFPKAERPDEYDRDGNEAWLERMGERFGFNSGAEFGYHLRDEEVKELKDYNVELSNKAISLMAEVERLKGLIEEAWKVTDGNRYTLEEFKQKHNL